METLIKVASITLVGTLIAFCTLLLLVLLGAASGWAVGLFFEDTIRSFFHLFGIETSQMEMWQIGAALAFIGAFFKTFNTAK